MIFEEKKVCVLSLSPQFFCVYGPEEGRSTGFFFFYYGTSNKISLFLLENFTLLHEMRIRSNLAFSFVKSHWLTVRLAFFSAVSLYKLLLSHFNGLFKCIRKQFFFLIYIIFPLKLIPGDL